MVILCIDDDPDDVQFFIDALRKVSASIEPIVAYNGQQAIDILSSGLVPNYVFLDVHMPVLSGLDTLKKIRTLKHMKSAPIFMYSTTMNPKEVSEYRKNGAEFLIKPSNFNDWCNTLANLLG